MNDNPELNSDLKFSLRYREVSFSINDWLLLALSLTPATLLIFGGMIDNATWLGIYTPLFHLSTLLLAVFAAGKRFRLRTSSAFLLACNAALIILGFVRRNLFLCCANCFVIPTLTALSLTNVCGINHHSPMTFSGICETLRRSLSGLFEYIPLPFVKLAAADEARAKHIPAILLSLCICIPILAIVLLLLISADQVFFNWFDVFSSSALSFFYSPAVLRLPLMLGAALMIFSWMFMLRRPGRVIPLPARPHVPSVFPSLLLPMLNAIYGIFVYIQFSNLFGGTETAAMTGGYAQYARSGFFQLVTIAFINLCIFAISMLSKRSAWIRIMLFLLLVLTGVILFSALWRMRLYIQVYGLTVLRIMTLWGMLVISALLIISTFTLIKANFRAFAAGLICTLVLWVGLNAIDIDRLIAEYNVFHYLSGDLAEIDCEYLRSLAPSAQNVVDQLERHN